jgi:hypothetical protein
MPTIKVPDNKNSHPYWPDELRLKGYTGNLEIIIGACSLVIPRPGTSSKQLAKDLRILADQFAHKAEIEESK